MRGGAGFGDGAPMARVCDLFALVAVRFGLINDILNVTLMASRLAGPRRMETPMAIPRTRPDGLPAILSYGFRPFFLFGAVYGALAVLLWVPMLTGHLETASLFSPIDWHAHEMLFGFLPAIVTGFLLTAIPNWTGRLPVQGYPLLGLVVLWLAGRVAVWCSAEIGWMAAMALDCAFLLAVAAAAGIEIVAGRNWRNLKVLAPVLALFLANVLFHAEADIFGATDMSRRLALSAALVLIMIIGGRIIPSFTRNWLARERPSSSSSPCWRWGCGRCSRKGRRRAFSCSWPAASTWRGWRAGPATGRCATGWSSCCMPPMPSCRSASSPRAWRRCFRALSRPSPASTSSASARSGR
jgi:hypothetical protein